MDIENINWTVYVPPKEEMPKNPIVTISQETGCISFNDDACRLISNTGMVDSLYANINLGIVDGKLAALLIQLTDNKTDNSLRITHKKLISQSKARVVEVTIRAKDLVDGIFATYPQFQPISNFLVNQKWKNGIFYMLVDLKDGYIDLKQP